jgi:bifunctional UDP-N-acetylglucosamine pyrophosphorylase/glucosamine-1-phosphate N-acetyltransferase
MKVLILAAGRSQRAKPIEDKNFLSFCGKTLIERQLEALSKAGFKDFLVVGGAHNKERLTKLLRPFKAKIFEQKNLNEGMAGAVLSVEKEVKNDDLFIVSGNDVVDEKAYELMKKAAKETGDSFLLAYKVKEYFPGGYLKIKGNRINGICEKPEKGKEPSKFINLVLHVHKNPKELFAMLKKVSTARDDRYECALDKLMKVRIFKPVKYDGFWQPVKYPWHVLDLQKYYLSTLKRKISPKAQIAKTAIIKGEVVIKEGAKIFDHAVVQGPAYIGENVVIGNNALVRESIIGDNSVVGFGSEVARSFIGGDCWFHTNYIGDSVMGENCSFGAGAVCAKLRLDEKEIACGGVKSGRNKLGPILGNNIRIGVQTSIMPGIKIGSNTMITSGLIIAEDIPEGKFVYGETKLKIKENKAVLNKSVREKMKGKL